MCSTPHCFLLPLARPHSTGNLEAEALAKEYRAIYMLILHFQPNSCSPEQF